jgi:hypothetical protein
MKSTLKMRERIMHTIVTTVYGIMTARKVRYSAF